MLGTSCFFHATILGDEYKAGWMSFLNFLNSNYRDTGNNLSVTITSDRDKGLLESMK